MLHAVLAILNKLDAFFVMSLCDLIRQQFLWSKASVFLIFYHCECFKVTNISSIIEGNKKPQILSVICFSSGNPCGPLLLLNRILSVTVILKITVVIWLSKDNGNVRTQIEAAGRHNEEEYIMTNWKTKGSLENTSYQSPITKKDRGQKSLTVPKYPVIWK